MAFVWVSCSKLVEFLKRFVSSSRGTKLLFLANGSFPRDVFSSVRKKPFLLVSSLCGVARKEEEKSTSFITEEVLHNVALATIALKDGNTEKSENMLQKTLDLAESYNISLGIISACDILSTLAMKLGEYNRAEELLLRALEVLHTQGAPEDDDIVVSFNLKLSRIHCNSGNDNLAELGFKSCIKAQKKKLANNQERESFLLWTTIMYWYGKFLQSKSRYEEAKTCFQECYSSSQSVGNLLPSQVMVILYNLGEVCQMLGKHDEALEYLLKGVSLDKKCKNPDLTYFYNKLGVVSMCKGLYEEAKLWCNRGHNFASKFQNQDAEKQSKECLEKINILLSH